MCCGEWLNAQIVLDLQAVDQFGRLIRQIDSGVGAPTQLGHFIIIVRLIAPPSQPVQRFPDPLSNLIHAILELTDYGFVGLLVALNGLVLHIKVTTCGDEDAVVCTANC